MTMLSLSDGGVFAKDARGRERLVAKVGGDGGVKFESPHYRRKYGEAVVALLAGGGDAAPAGGGDDEGAAVAVSGSDAPCAGDGGVPVDSGIADAGRESGVLPGCSLVDKLPCAGGDAMGEGALPPAPALSRHFGQYTKEWLLWDAFHLSREQFSRKWEPMRRRNRSVYAGMLAWGVASEFAAGFRQRLGEWGIGLE